MKREEYEKELKETMQELKKVWRKCLEIFNDCDNDCNEYIVENYPFDSSFDEINVEEWCDTIMDKIEKNKVEQEKNRVLKERGEQEIEI